MSGSLNKIIQGKGLPKLLFLPGNCSSSRSVKPLMNQVSDSQCIAFDYPGCGNSYRASNPHKEYSYASLKSIVKKSINEIDGPKILIGISLGGHILSEISGSLSEVKALILSGAPPVRQPLNLDEAFLPNDLSGIFYAKEVNREQVELYLQKATFQKKCDHLIISDFLKTDPRFREVFAETIFDEIEDEIKLIDTCRFPIYVIHGSEDPMISEAYLKSLAFLSGFFAIENCGHYPHLEHPEQFADIIQSIKSRIIL